MASELEYLRRDRDRWIEAWRKSIGDAEQMRRCHEVALAQRTAERDALAAEVAALKAERDEARRDWCYAVAIGHERAEERARLRGWDCFEETKP